MKEPMTDCNMRRRELAYLKMRIMRRVRANLIKRNERMNDTLSQSRVALKTKGAKTSYAASMTMEKSKMFHDISELQKKYHRWTANRKLSSNAKNTRKLDSMACICIDDPESGESLTCWMPWSAEIAMKSELSAMTMATSAAHQELRMNLASGPRRRGSRKSTHQRRASSAKAFNLFAHPACLKALSLMSRALSTSKPRSCSDLARWSTNSSLWS
mmetsp:Transcript_48654/g.136881  ORF Transcript_48654/g.136881 Transcript_48654/m.136881 type:complete len:215 (+) Transcript_48654:888-1532(+)